MLEQITIVSMKSGLEGRNNVCGLWPFAIGTGVSMMSGLEGRNNQVFLGEAGGLVNVSMKSGLEGRNNHMKDPELVTEAYKSQ